MVEVAIPMRGNDRVPSLAGKRTAGIVPRASVQRVPIYAFEHDLVEADSGDDEVRDGRSAGDEVRLPLTCRARFGERDDFARLAIVPRAARFIRLDEADGVAPDGERQRQPARDVEGRAQQLTHLGERPAVR